MGVSDKGWSEDSAEGLRDLEQGARVGPWLQEAKTYLMELRFSNRPENMHVPSAEEQWRTKSRVGQA